MTLFAFGRTVRCTCGRRVDARSPHTRPPAFAEAAKTGEAAELKRRADAITWTLLYSRLPRVDLEIRIANLRAWVEDHLPERLGLFEMVYEARWTRMREQGWEHDRPDV